MVVEQTIHYWDFSAYDYRFVAWAQPERDGQGHAIDWTGIAKPEVTVYPAVTIGEQSPYQITNNFATFSKDVSNLLSVTVAADVSDTLHAPMVSKMEVVKPSSLRTSTGMGSVVLHFSRPFCRVRFLLETRTAVTVRWARPSPRPVRCAASPALISPRRAVMPR